ncbi:MAG: ABATE domain-containing protein [Solirubrobacteraceae bacterium]|nr:ABATE domain-containing protein [Solirubrobacteraceae bacterium]
MDLPDVLELPLASGAPYWYWLGGRPSLDFVNTLRERWRRNVETLTSFADLEAWLHQADLLPDDARPTRRSRATVLEEARALREAIDVCVTATVAGRPLDPAAITTIDDWLVHAGSRPQLAVGPDGVPALGERDAADSPRRALGTIALDAATMLGTAAQTGRIRICAADDCSARFYDRSPAGRRRWCSMQTCGNAAKVRAHRARAKGAAA